MSPGGQQRKWPHLKMNPWGETPTLDLGNGSFLSVSTEIARYMDHHFSGQKVMGETALEQGQDTMWDSRIYTHILYRIVTMFHVMHQGLGLKIELTNNLQWGEHCRKKALAHAGLVNQHLADGREWLLGGQHPTFTDINLCTAIALSKFPANQTPLDECFEYLDYFWQRWQKRESFKTTYADGNSGLSELSYLKSE